MWTGCGVWWCGEGGKSNGLRSQMKAFIFQAMNSAIPVSFVSHRANLLLVGLLLRRRR